MIDNMGFLEFGQLGIIGFILFILYRVLSFGFQEFFPEKATKPHERQMLEQLQRIERSIDRMTDAIREAQVPLAEAKVRQEYMEEGLKELHHLQIQNSAKNDQIFEIISRLDCA